MFQNIEHNTKRQYSLTMKNIFSGLITSETRVRILMRLFLNPVQRAYLRELASEFNLAPSQVHEELKRLKESGLLNSTKNGRQINYSANQSHPLFSELHSMVKKAMGMDRILDSIINRLGNLEKAYLIDDYATGKDSGLIDLVLVGDINETTLKDLVGKTEKYIGRKIRTLVLKNEESRKIKQIIVHRPKLVLWEKNNNHTNTTSSHSPF
jgi:DNA-binding transcriptional ArsR family regulator